MEKQAISTHTAPAAIGTYSQAIRAGNTVYISGQIPLDPKSGEIVDGGIEAEVEQVFSNLNAVAQAAGLGLKHAVKINVFLIDLGNFALVNETMARYFDQPYPARAAVQVAALPKGVAVEADAVLVA